MNTIFSLGRYFYHFFIGELIKFRWGGSKVRWGLRSLKYGWGMGKILWGPVSLGVLQRGVNKDPGGLHYLMFLFKSHLFGICLVFREFHLCIKHVH